MKIQKTILVGSRAFFGNIDGFTSKDYDYVLIVNREDVEFDYKNVISSPEEHICRFIVVKRPAGELVDWVLTHGSPLTLGQFLVPEYIKEMGITMQHLRKLQPLAEMIDKRHEYVQYIYYAYILNGDFVLTDEQQKEAFELYKKNRQL